MLRLHHLGTRSLWIDEAFSVWMARHNWPALWAWTVRIDQHPPLYYAGLHLWGTMWGWSEGSVRGFSLLAAMLTLPLVMALGHRLGGHWGALWSGTVFALSPFHILYAQEARMYSWMVLTTTWTLWGTLRLLDRDWDVMGILGMLGGMTASLWLHNTGGFLLLSLAVGMGLTGRFSSVRKGGTARWLLLVALAMWAPWWPFLWHQARGVWRRFWIPYPTWRTLPDTLHLFHWGPVVPDGFLFHLGDLLWLGLVLWGTVALWARRRAWAGILLSLFLVPLLGELAVSLVRPIFLPRTLLWTTIPYILLGGVGVSSLRRRYGVWALCLPAVLLLLMAVAWHHYDGDYEKENWRGAVSYMRARAQPGDLVLFNATWTQIPFDYYAAEDGLHLEEHGVPVNLFDRGELEPAMTEADVPRLRALLRQRTRVWLVYSHAWYTDPEAIIPAVLDSEMRRVEERRFVGIRVVLYSKRRTSDGGG